MIFITSETDVNSLLAIKRKSVLVCDQATLKGECKLGKKKCPFGGSGYVTNDNGLKDFQKFTKSLVKKINERYYEEEGGVY